MQQTMEGGIEALENAPPLLIGTERSQSRS